MRRHEQAGDRRLSERVAWARRMIPRRRSGRKPSRSTVIFGSLAIFLAVVVAGGTLAAYAKYRGVWDGIHRIDVRGDLTSRRPPADPNAQNILIIGSDTRVGRNGKIGGAPTAEGARSDTVMVLHVAPGAHQVVVLSFPRDSVVPILSCTPEGGTSGQTAQPSYAIEQINASFANGGPGCLWKTIEQTTGIHINDFVELTFVGFQKVIDVLHGVTVCLPVAINDPISRLDLSAGRHHVFGREALAFWRTREGVGLGDDPQRIQRDQYLMAALVKGIEHSGLLTSPRAMLSVIDTLTSGGYVTTDSSLTPAAIIRLGEALRGISTQSVQFVTAPWTTYTGNAQWISSSQSPATGNSNWVQWVQPQANELFSAIAHDVKLPTGSKQKEIKSVNRGASPSPSPSPSATASGSASGSPSPSAAISNLAGTYGGITANVNICNNASAFSG